MDKLIEVLENKYNIIISQNKDNELNQEKVKKDIDKLINSFDNIEVFGSEEINNICAMLDSESALLFRGEERYFKMLKKFPNQPQIKNAKKIIEETKKILRKKLEENNKDVFDLVLNSSKKINELEKNIEILKNYDSSKYINASILYSVADNLNNNDIDESIIDFYNTILINNNSLDSSEECESIDLKIYDSFIKRVKQINKSMSIEQVNDDKKILRVLKIILERNYAIYYDDDDIEEIIDILYKYITTEEDREMIKRVKFLIHLHNVEVDLTDEQIEFATTLKDFYEERVVSSNISDTASKNTELLSYLEDDYKFENVGLLLKVFDAMEIKRVEQLKIISSIMMNNSRKKNSEKIDLSKGVIELFKENNISVEYLSKEDIDRLNDNLENVSEVLTRLINLNYDLVKELSEDVDQINILLDMLMYSSKEIINKFDKICNQEDIDLISLLNYSPYVLISSSIKKIGCGEFDRFIENIEFCKSNNISVKAIEDYILEDTKVLYNRYMIFTNLYKIDITGNEKILGLPFMINTLDRLIESHRLGYKLIKTNLSKLVENYVNLYFYTIIKPELLFYNEKEDKVEIDESLLRKVSEACRKFESRELLVRSRGKYWNEKMDFFVSLFKSENEDENMLVIPEKYNYIDESIFENSYIEKLENPKNKIKKSDFIYSLDGNYISRIKFLRVCTYLNDILPKYNSSLNCDAIKFALRFEKILEGSCDSKIEHFDTLKIESKTKKKKKK